MICENLNGVQLMRYCFKFTSYKQRLILGETLRILLAELACHSPPQEWQTHPQWHTEYRATSEPCLCQHHFLQTDQRSPAMENHLTELSKSQVSPQHPAIFRNRNLFRALSL